MDRPRTVIASTAAAVLFVLRPDLTLADTGAPPTDGNVVVSQPFDPSGPIALSFLVAVLLVTVIVVLRRPGLRRPIAAIVTVAVAGVIALLSVLAGLFSDWSGQHRISVIPVVIGVVVLVVGIWIAAGILRRRDG